MTTKQHGGPRPGAGRKPLTPPRRQVHLHLPAALVDAIDTRRGAQSRNAWIETTLTDALHPRRPRPPGTGTGGQETPQ